MLIQVRSTTRATPRHHVEIPCEIVSSRSDAPTLAWATDMSADGLWLDDREDLELDESVVICFKPGVFWRAHELMVFANVKRVSPGLREDDIRPGLGLAFADLQPSERWALRAWLRPRPEKHPSRRRRERNGRERRNTWLPPMMPASPFARRLD